MFIRKRTARRHKGPLQLDLFVPREHRFEFKLIVTNKSVGAGTVLRFHEGRGAQEGIFGELKTHCAMGHVPVRRRLGNQMYLLAGLLAHNLIGELQMRTSTPARGTTDNRAALWIFEQADTTLTMPRFLLISSIMALLGVGFGAIAGIHPGILPVMALVMALLPLMWLLMRRKKRMKGKNGLKPVCARSDPSWMPNGGEWASSTSK